MNCRDDNAFIVGTRCDGAVGARSVGLVLGSTRDSRPQTTRRKVMANPDDLAPSPGSRRRNRAELARARAGTDVALGQDIMSALSRSHSRPRQTTIEGLGFTCYRLVPTSEGLQPVELMVIRGRMGAFMR